MALQLAAFLDLCGSNHRHIRGKAGQLQLILGLWVFTHQTKLIVSKETTQKKFGEKKKERKKERKKEKT